MTSIHALVNSSAAAVLPLPTSCDSFPHVRPDVMAAEESLWAASPKSPLRDRLTAPRRRGLARQALHKLQPLIPALAGTTALTCLATATAATFAPCCWGENVNAPTSRFFTAQNGTIQGTVVAPWDAYEQSGKSTYRTNVARELADNFLGAIMTACNVSNVTTAGINATAQHIPAYIEANWYVRTFVNTFNISGAVSTAVQCIFNRGNHAYT